MLMRQANLEEVRPMDYTTHEIYEMAKDLFGEGVVESEVIRNAFDLVYALDFGPNMVIDGVPHDVVEEFCAGSLGLEGPTTHITYLA